MCDERGRSPDPDAPRVLRARNGWLAVSRDESTFRVGVTGTTEEEAFQRFTQAVAAIRAVREQPWED